MGKFKARFDGKHAHAMRFRLLYCDLSAKQLFQGTIYKHALVTQPWIEPRQRALKYCVGPGTSSERKKQRLPRQLLYEELVSGKLSQERTRKGFKKFLKEHLKWCDIETSLARIFGRASTEFEKER